MYRLNHLYFFYSRAFCNLYPGPGGSAFREVSCPNGSAANLPLLETKFCYNKSK